VQSVILVNLSGRAEPEVVCRMGVKGGWGVGLLRGGSSCSDTRCWDGGNREGIFCILHACGTGRSSGAAERRDRGKIVDYKSLARETGYEEI
jgi:hypothetical protein